MKIAESNFSIIPSKIIGLAVTGFAAYKFEINPGFFSFLLAVGALFLFRTRSSLELNRTSLVIHRGKILDFFFKPKSLKFNEIENVEFEPSKLNWQLIAISLVLRRSRVRNPNTIHLQLKDENWMSVQVPEYAEDDLSKFIGELVDRVESANSNKRNRRN